MINLNSNLSEQNLKNLIFASEKFVKEIVPAEKKVLLSTPLLQFLDCVVPQVEKHEIISSFRFPLNYQAIRRIQNNYIVSALVDSTDNILDIGSHHGNISHFLCKFTKGKLLLVDCSVKAWSISRNLGKFEFEQKSYFENCVYFYGGLGEENNFQKFYESSLKSVSSSLLKENAIKSSRLRTLFSIDKVLEYDVPIYSYQEINNLFNADLVKMNIEGMDIVILKQILESNNEPHSIYLEVAFEEDFLELINIHKTNYKTLLGVYFNPEETSNINELNDDQIKKLLFRDLTENKNIQGIHHLIISKKDKEELLNSLIASLNSFKNKWEIIT